MKTLKPKELIELLPAKSQQAMTAAERLASMLSAFDSVQAFQYSVTEGFAECQQVLVDGQTAYLVFFTVDKLRSAISFGAVQVGEGGHWPALMEALERIACERKCRWIHCLTRRAGVVKQMGDYGYRPDTVNLVKELR